MKKGVLLLPLTSGYPSYAARISISHGWPHKKGTTVITVILVSSLIFCSNSVCPKKHDQCSIHSLDRVSFLSVAINIYRQMALNMFLPHTKIYRKMSILLMIIVHKIIVTPSLIYSQSLNKVARSPCVSLGTLAT